MTHVTLIQGAALIVVAWLLVLYLMARVGH